MTIIKGKLVTQAGSPTRIQYVMLKNKNVRVSVDGELITGESVMIPVEEDGNIEFTAEPGPAVMVIWRDSEMESLSHLVPLWIQDVDEDTIENAFRLGKEHDADVHSPSIVEIIKMTVDAHLEGYATESWVNDIIDAIELTPGDKGDPGDPGDSAYEIWIDAGNEGTEADFLSSLKGEKGDPGEGGTGDSDMSPMRTTTGISVFGDTEDISSAKPGDLRIDTYTGKIYRAKGTFNLTPVYNDDTIQVTENPLGTVGVYEPGQILKYGNSFYQADKASVVNPSLRGDIFYAMNLHNSGSVEQGSAFYVSNNSAGLGGYHVGIYIFDDTIPVVSWETFKTLEGPQGPKGDKGDPGEPGSGGTGGSGEPKAIFRFSQEEDWETGQMVLGHEVIVNDFEKIDPNIVWDSGERIFMNVPEGYYKWELHYNSQFSLDEQVEIRWNEHGYHNRMNQQLARIVPDNGYGGYGGSSVTSGILQLLPVPSSGWNGISFSMESYDQMSSEMFLSSGTPFLTLTFLTER